MKITELCNDVLGLIGEEVKKHPRYIMIKVCEDINNFNSRTLEPLDFSGISLRYLGRLYGLGRDFAIVWDTVEDLVPRPDDEAHWPVCGGYN